MQETTDSEAFSDRDSPSHDNQSLHRSKSHHDLPIISDFDFDQVSSERHSYSISSTVEFPNTDRNPQVNPLLRSSFPTLERIKAQHQINSKYKNREKRVQAKKNLLEVYCCLPLCFLLVISQMFSSVLQKRLLTNTHSKNLNH